MIHAYFSEVVGNFANSSRQQTNAKTALQCLDNQDTYRVASPYDYCGGALSSGWVWPVPGYRTLGILSWGENGHKGIDIGAPIGTRVVAAHAGTVTQRYIDSRCGLFMVIKAKDTPYWHAYQHMANARVSVGQFVNAGQHIADIGSAGGSTCGTGGYYHLHFSVEKGDWISWYSSPLSNSINPLSVLPD